MKFLDKDEIKTLRYFLKMPIPAYVYAYESTKFNLMDCYEVAFTYANALLRRQKINPRTSPWGDGESVIFDSDYTELLLNIQRSDLEPDMKNYCGVFLKILDIFKAHLA